MQIALAVKFTNTTSGGAIGLAMVSLMGFNTSLFRVVSSWTNMETSLGAAARMCAFVRDTPSESCPTENQAPPREWPSLEWLSGLDSCQRRLQVG